MVKKLPFTSISSILIVSSFLAFGMIRPVSGQSVTLDGWTFRSAREEIAPRHWIEQDIRHGEEPSLALAGDGKKHADGTWFRVFSVDPDTSYVVEVNYLSRNVEEQNRSVLARLLWLDAQGDLIGQPEYPRVQVFADADTWGSFKQVYESPSNAVQARVEVIYRWDENGEAYFAPAHLQKTYPVQPRRVSLGTVHYRPKTKLTREENLNRFAELIADAAQQGADIICLPEGITYAGSGKTIIEVSEPIPGPTTAFLGQIARAHNVYIVAGLDEREGEVVYNTAVLIGRDGKLQGKYRKVCLPREEIEAGVTPGNEFPTFETDFGRIGIMICWDVSFPEPARMLGLAGAEVIFLPIWGGILTLTRARAIENQAYLVTSSYDSESAVFDLEGEIMKEATDANPVAVVEVDLNQQKLWPWLGDFKNRISSEMPSRAAIRYSVGNEQ